MLHEARATLVAHHRVSWQYVRPGVGICDTTVPLFETSARPDAPPIRIWVPSGLDRNDPENAPT